jgi:5-methylcytosine-specific restriction endonuclease McrA
VHLLPSDTAEWVRSSSSGLTYCNTACCQQAYQPLTAPVSPEASEDLEISEIPKSDLASVPESPNPSEDELTDKIAKNNPIDINDLEKPKMSVYSLEPFSADSTCVEASPAPAHAVAVLEIPEPKRRGRPRRWKDDRERKQFERARPRVEGPIPIDRLPEPAASQPIRARALRKTARNRSYHVPEYVRLAKIEEQNNECLYCSREFGSAVTNAGVIENLRPEVDHLHPQAGGGRTNEKNVHYACHVCNRLKSDFLFDTVDEVKAFLVEEWERKGYKTCPPAVPFTADMDLLIAYFRNGGSLPCSRPAEALPELRKAAA